MIPYHDPLTPLPYSAMGRVKSRGPEVNVVNVVNVLPYTWKRKKVSYFTKGENVNNVNNVNHPQTGPKPDLRGTVRNKPIEH